MVTLFTECWICLGFSILLLILFLSFTSFLFHTIVAIAISHVLVFFVFFFLLADKYFVNKYFHQPFSLVVLSISKQCQELQFNIKLSWFNRYLLLKASLLCCRHVSNFLSTSAVSLRSKPDEKDRWFVKVGWAPGGTSLFCICHSKWNITFVNAMLKICSWSGLECCTSFAVEFYPCITYTSLVKISVQFADICWFHIVPFLLFLCNPSHSELSHRDFWKCLEI